MQDEYSLLYREEEREMLTYCKFHGIGVIPWSLLAAGDLDALLAPSLFGLTLPEARNSKGSSQRDLSKGDEPHRGCRRVEENIVTGIVLTPEEVAYLEAPCIRAKTCSWPRLMRGRRVQEDVNSCRSNRKQSITYSITFIEAMLPRRRSHKTWTIELAYAGLITDDTQSLSSTVPTAVQRA
ncbi:hypothetical protein JVT61DRAFT_9965 [Boletus reticuloceps]|uniref:Uncharacterized protein n=1 Tax=Boletus reticuloceps TaxID=495285 RepID=A0A8I2YVS3_9AGAM|nr:hypothetical protein JVT61DRAFT_9965 [Boletus reticuloceps]